LCPKRYPFLKLPVISRILRSTHFPGRDCRGFVMTLTVRALPRKQFTDVRDTIAALRIAVFREWPYLYDGDMAYEQRYLQAYMDNPDAFLLGVFHGAEMVGASTASPLAFHHQEFSKPMQ